ncbi:YqhG family protein [Metabacillus sp. 84]|uniref:YqhG family protein n=1 Tax=unclassified Metabacillus TaxID=2675274 RepID=UPI003CEF31DB
MNQQQIYGLLERFFKANYCDVSGNGAGSLAIQLTPDMDKELMNRPFYWHYLEKTGGEPNPMKLHLLTDRDAETESEKPEFIHFGSPRLHQIFRSAQKLGSFARMYEKSAAIQGQQPLHPWLGINITVSYQCDMKKDVVYSIGLHLISGTMVEGFQDRLNELVLTPTIPDFSFTLSPLILPKSGMQRIRTHIEQRISEDDHTWAEEAKQRWNADLMLLHHFYEDMEEKPEVYELEKGALKDLYEPRIHISVNNGGIFYLNEKTIF